ncbi:MAG: YbjQ family protein [Desulfatibacillaceae bacterium]
MYDTWDIVLTLWPYIAFVATLLLGYAVGKLLEKRHYRLINEREAKVRSLPVSGLEEGPEQDTEIRKAELVMGSAVISVDYFKRILSGLQNIVGGRVTAYETLVDRARREAVLRMIESAVNADGIQNVRIETSPIGQADRRRKKAVACLEALAYGTAVWYVK